MCGVWRGIEYLEKSARKNRIGGNRVPNEMGERLDSGAPVENGGVPGTMRRFKIQEEVDVRKSADDRG